ncbi:MAG: hypothetical protein ACYCPX_12740 [Acidiferrobacteraceae bacterium]
MNQAIDVRSYAGSKKGQVYPELGINLIQIDLTNGLTNYEVSCPGNFLHADSESTGLVFVSFNQPSVVTRYPFRANLKMGGFNIDKIYLNATAQSGSKLNLWYGYAPELTPPNSDISTIGSITAPVTIAQGAVINDPTLIALANANQAYEVAAGSGTTWKQIVFANRGNTNIYLGGAGVNANSPIVLPAQSPAYVEDRICQANWYGWSDAANGSLAVMTFQ